MRRRRARRVVVVGLGTSGIAAARLLLARGARVDRRPTARRASELSPRRARSRARASRSRSAATTARASTAADLVVVSPGVPSFPALDAAERAGVEVIGEVELAVALRRRAPIVADRRHQRQEHDDRARRRAARARRASAPSSAATSATPLADARRTSRATCVVVEVSSFQLERVADASRPRVSVLLNVTDDHLDRYPSFAAYADAKGNAVRQPDRGRRRGRPRRRRAVRRAGARAARARVVTFGAERRRRRRVASDAIVDRATGARYPLARRRASRARTTSLNAARRDRRGARARRRAARRSREALARFAGARRTAWRSSREIDGVRYYDDSRAPTSAPRSPRSRGLAEPQGRADRRRRDKGGSYAPLVDALREQGPRRSCSSARRADRIARRRRRTRSRSRARGDRWTRRSRRAPSSRSRATRCCSAPRARASTCSATTRTAATPSSARSRELPRGGAS